MKKLFISFILICFLVSNAYAVVVGYSRTFGGGTTDYTQDANCMGAWLMTSNTGDESDVSGEGETLTETGGSIPTSTDVPPGYSGTSRDFEYDDSEYLFHNDGGSTDIYGATQQISVVFWVKLGSMPGAPGYVGKWSGGYNFTGNNYPLQMFLRDFADTVNTSAQAGTSISLATWYHVAMVSDNTNITIYLDAVVDSNGANNPKAYSAGIANSVQAFTVGSLCDALMDEVAVFDRALSPSEVLGIYNDGIDGTKGGND